jgi:urea transporter
VYKNPVAALQLAFGAAVGPVRAGLFAYNEAPTTAVAIACWFRARRISTRPFFLGFVRLNSIT